ncbi:MAG: hypothetical protein MUD07_00770, partial [Burkholderiaceae bacterium]|nr:hypothetical protein [Burkholderiaceae bacterium]
MLRCRVEFGAVHLVGAVAGQDVVARGLFVPEIGRAGHLADHHRLVPLQAPGRVLVFVRQTDGVAEFVRRGAAVHEAQVHGGLV